MNDTLDLDLGDSELDVEFYETIRMTNQKNEKKNAVDVKAAPATQTTSNLVYSVKNATVMTDMMREANRGVDLRAGLLKSLGQGRVTKWVYKKEDGK